MNCQIYYPELELKAKYKFLENIATTGTQRITLTIPSNIDFEISSNFIKSGSNYPRLLKTGSYNVEIKSSTSFYFGSEWNAGMTIVGVDSICKKTSGTFYITVNGTTKSTSYSATSSGTMYLFGESGTGNGSTVTFYSMKIYTQGTTTLLFDLAPCLQVSDKTLGLYDRVNKKFYANSGSGSFTGGAETGEVIYG